MSDLVFIIAGHPREASEWAKENLEDPGNFHYVRDYHMMDGETGVYALVGNYTVNPVYQDPRFQQAVAKGRWKAFNPQQITESGRDLSKILISLELARQHGDLPRVRQWLGVIQEGDYNDDLDRVAMLGAPFRSPTERSDGEVKS